MKLVSRLAVIAMLCSGSFATAQLKPSGPGTPPLPPPGAAASDTTRPASALSAQAVKELAAQAAAEKWLALLDAGQYGKAWDECAPMFRDRVTRTQWLESLPPNRARFGAFKSRRAEVASFKTSLPGVPEGEYVTVRFSTTFAEKADAEELLTLVFDKGTWRPTGYMVQ